MTITAAKQRLAQVGPADGGWPMSDEAKDTHDEYLGDDIYVSYDGCHIWLDLRAQQEFPIALSPEVVIALWEYAHRVTEKQNEEVP